MTLRAVWKTLLVAAALVAISCHEEVGEVSSEGAPLATRAERLGGNSTEKVLILGSTVRGGATSREARAATRLGYEVDVVTPEQWRAMSAQQFMGYAALIIGDAACQAGEEAFAAAIENRGTWGAIVDGTVVIIGADPVSNHTPLLVENAIQAVTERPYVTGMYVALGCAYKEAPPGTPVTLLEPFGTFQVAGVGCIDSAHSFQMHPPTISNLLPSSLAGNGCAARSVFTQYPHRTFAFVTLGLRSSRALPGEQSYEDFLEGRTYVGAPYVLIRGAMAQSAGCGLGAEPAGEECDLGDGNNGIPAGPNQPPERTCSFSCRRNWCGDGVVDAAHGEECDNGYLNGRDMDGNLGTCTGFCKLPNIESPPDSPPKALCKNVTVVARDTCGVAADINDGSHDPDGDLVSCTPSPAGPYPIGTTTVTLTCTDAASHSASCQGLVTVVDKVVPALTLLGSSTDSLECGTEYEDLGATAHDLCSGDMTGSIVKTGAVNPSKAGLYEVSYDVTDEAGNSPDAVTRWISVDDTLAPTLTLNGLPNVGLECGTPYTDPGAMAHDQCAGDLTDAIQKSGSVNAQVPGSYVLTYEVSDPSGQAAPARTRVVTVADTRKPVVTVNGPQNIELECGDSTYVDPGATAFDLCAGDLTPNIAVSSNLDRSRAGQYQTTYSVADSAGNVGTAVRQITVRGSCSKDCLEVRLSDYNLFLLEDYHGGHDVEGKVAAGGNITMTHFSVGHVVPDGSTSRTLVAGGNLTLAHGGVWGEVFHGGSFSADGTVVFPRGHTATQGTPIDFAARFAELRSLSAKLAAMTPNGRTTRKSWGGILLRGRDPKLNVFQVDASAFTGAKLLSIEAPAGSLAVINIHGASATFTGFGHSFSGGIDQRGILYNFVDATAIHARGFGFWGTVLAPYAHVNFSDGSFDGGLYAVSMTGNAEGHVNALYDRDVCR